MIGNVLAIGFDGGRLEPMFGIDNPLLARFGNGRLGARVDTGANVDADGRLVGICILFAVECPNVAIAVLIAVINDPCFLLLA